MIYECRKHVRLKPNEQLQPSETKTLAGLLYVAEAGFYFLGKKDLKTCSALLSLPGCGGSKQAGKQKQPILQLNSKMF